MMDEQMLVNQISVMMMLGIGAVIGAIVMAIGFSIFLTVSVKVMRAKEAVDDFRDMRRAKREETQE